ncbi:unnamed protein product [Meloidogyne enterolobii]|uniref:Uncharacterized protein n=1 Tax=Meloidogyne enterolobii TaxID=390850 RepID=A0ACB0ZGI7_MELEN
MKDSSATIDILFFKLGSSKIKFCGKRIWFHDTTCFKKQNIRSAEGWKIVDSNYIDQKYQNLLTFHILPVKAMRESMQNIWEHCGEDCDLEATMQKCEKMFVKFVGYFGCKRNKIYLI